MPNLFQYQSPLRSIDFEKTLIEDPKIVEIAFLGFINLRGKPDNPAFMSTLSNCLGCTPPIQTNCLTESEHYRLYCLGPDEWLVITPRGQNETVSSELGAALQGTHSSVVDYSSGFTLLKITGHDAGDLLARDCPLDLHPRALKVGQCAQTRLGKAFVIIAPLRDSLGFEVIIRRSFADYLGLWMQQVLEQNAACGLSMTHSARD